MKTLRATQQFDSLYSCSDRFKEDDLFSLDDINASKRTTSSTSIFNDYGFSDNEEEKHTSFKLQESLYFDDVPVDMNEKRTKKVMKQQNQPASRTSGALEELFAPTAPTLTPKQNRAKRPSTSSTTKDGTKGLKTPLSSASKSRSSPAISELRKTSQLSHRGRSISNFHNSFSEGENFVWEVNEDDYETDTDDEGLEFGSDGNEVSSLKRKSLIKKALARTFGNDEDKIPRTPRKRSSSKKRMMESLSATSLRAMDALSISNRSTRRDKSLTRKFRSSSLSGPRLRRASTKKDFLEGSDTTVDRKPRRRSSSLKSISSRRCLSLDDSPLVDSPSTPKERKRRSLSKPKRSKKKSVDQSSRSATGDDDKSQRSVSVNRRRKKSLDCSSHGRSSSITGGKKDRDSSTKRSSSVKRKKSKDQMDRSSFSQVSSGQSDLQENSGKSKQRRVPIKRSSSSVMIDDRSIKKSESSPSLSSNSRNGRRVSKGSNRSNNPVDMMSLPSPKQRRVPITKKALNDAGGEEFEPKASGSSSSNSELLKRNSKSSKRSSKNGVSPLRSSKTKRSKSPKRSDTLQARSEEFSATTNRKLNNASLSSSEHGRSRRSSVKGSRDFEAANKDRDEEKFNRKMKRRNSSSVL